MKTGSTGTDCWMIGYNPDILMLVWNGYDDNQEMEVADGSISKNIWVNTVEEYLKDKEASWYHLPNNVIGIPLDAVTGTEPTDENNIFVYYFINGSQYVNQETIEKKEGAVTKLSD